MLAAKLNCVIECEINFLAICMLFLSNQLSVEKDILFISKVF